MTTLWEESLAPAVLSRLYPSLQDALDATPARIKLSQDPDSGVVCNSLFDSDLVQYDQTYQSDASLSKLFQLHLDLVANICAAHLEPNGSIVDVGCGQGAFVETLRKKGVHAHGYDNAYKGNNPFIRKELFSPGIHEKSSLVSLRHVLEHISDPYEFVHQIATANEFSGLLYIEVPDLDWILQNSSYWDIFYEHVNYFRIKDFQSHFGDSIVSSTRTFNGQYISVVIDMHQHAQMSRSGCPSIEKGEREMLQAQFDSLKRSELSAHDSLAAFESAVIWGAAAKGVNLASKISKSEPGKIRYAIDINPKMHGKFMPLSGARVLNPEEGISSLNPNSLVIVMNSNYINEIRSCLPRDQPVMCL